jgi:hypothetical protein
MFCESEGEAVKKERSMTMESSELVQQHYFDQARPRLTRLVARLGREPEEAITAAAAIFAEMLPTMAYLDKPEHPLAAALFTCNVNIALWLALRERGVRVEEFGQALLTGLRLAPLPMPTESPAEREQRLEHFRAAALASRQASPLEDVFDVVDPLDDSFTWGFDVHSCAILKSAQRHGAAELMPFLCAVDDVMSDKGDQGLRRTGTLALGARTCDFRYQPGGSPLRLPELPGPSK